MSFKYYNERTGQYEVLTVPTLKGERGERGEPGVPGAKGEAGATPHLTIGTVVTLEPEREASVTIRGTKENPILDISIPRGGRGEKGIFVGSKEDAPLSAEIVIDHSDEGSFIGGGIEEKLVEVPIVDGVLTLTKDKYQTTTMENNTTVVLPTVNKVTEIHLFFNATSELTLVLPNVKWQAQPTIEAYKVYEFIFTYTTEWFGGFVGYDSPPESPVMDGLICWLDAHDIKTGDTAWEDRSNSGYVFEIIGNPVVENGFFHFNASKPYARCANLEVDIDSVTVQCSLKDITLGNNSYIYSIAGYGNGLSLSQHGSAGIRLNANGANRQITRGSVKLTSYLTAISTTDSLELKMGDSLGEKRNFTSPLTGRISGMEIGKEWNYTGGTGFEGRIGSLLIYNRALTEEEIQQNYLYEQSINRG